MPCKRFSQDARFRAVTPSSAAAMTEAAASPAVSQYTRAPASPRFCAPPDHRRRTKVSDAVLLATTGEIALLTLNRPDKLNALNYEMIDRVMELLDEIEVASDVRAVILTGAGSARSPPALTSMSFRGAWRRGRTRQCATSSGAGSE
jgi:hypothetical protein